MEKELPLSQEGPPKGHLKEDLAGPFDISDQCTSSLGHSCLKWQHRGGRVELRVRAVVGAEILLGKINSLLSLKQTYPAMWEAADIFIGELTLS